MMSEPDDTDQAATVTEQIMQRIKLNAYPSFHMDTARDDETKVTSRDMATSKNTQNDDDYWLVTEEDSNRLHLQGLKHKKMPNTSTPDHDKLKKVNNQRHKKNS